VCALYVATVAAGLAQTGVGPLPGIPAVGNGLIAGFPGSTGVLPGLLALGTPAAAPPAAAHAVGGDVRAESRRTRTGAGSATGAAGSEHPDRPASSGSATARLAKVTVTRSTASIRRS
jgi:hypothetical protein